ncbi:MAG: hypothetical protein JWP87_233 [Labilithrix sp.]|nr:hypothetical protein [Labilithrix sp.]
MEPRRFLGLTSALALCMLPVLAPACHAEASVKASTNDQARGDDTETASAPAPAPVAPAAAAAPAAPSTPPADACPLTCFEARGSERVDLTNEEVTQLRSALEPVIGRMRSCSSAEEWRRYGSAVVNLRIAPDGTLAELGVDPHHGREAQCFDDAGRGASPSLSLPGRKVVRCAEHCVREAPRRGSGGRRGRGR